MRLPDVSTKLRFHAAYLLLAFLAALYLVLFVAQLKAGVHSPAHRARPVRAAVCVAVGCAKLGDHVSYVLDGQVTQVSSPQAGVVCLQVQSRSHGGDYCALSG